MLKRRTVALVVACSGAFLAFLDTTIVNVSFPSISASFPEATRSQLSWILDAYFIVMAALLVPAGGIADRLGRKRVFQAGLAGFVVTSVLCAVAPTWELLVAARVLQGVTAAVIAPVSLSLILPEYSLADRAKGVGFYGAAAALAAAMGPPLGGVLVEVADWRWIFLVNVPLGVVAYAAGRRVLTESVDETGAGLPDLLGAAFAAGGLGLLALGIVEGGAWGWASARVLGCFVIGTLLFGALVRRCLSHPRPLVDPAMVRLRGFTLANIGTLLFAMAFFSAILGNILFLTGVWGYSVLEAGLAVMPGPLASTVVAGLAGSMAARRGFRTIIVPGTVVYAVGLLIIRSAGAQPDYLTLWLPGQVLVGIGIGLAFPTLGAAAANEVSVDQFASASAVTSAFRQFGAVLGTAILIAIIGTPASLADAMRVADNAYVFGIVSALVAGVVALTLTKVPSLAADTALEPAAAA